MLTLFRRSKQQPGVGISFFFLGVIFSCLILWIHSVFIPSTPQEHEYSANEELNQQIRCMDFFPMIQPAKAGGEKGSGGKLRTPIARDLPPETQPGWDPTAPEEPVSRFPKALILGFAKCGTAALVTFLPLHPDIVTINWEINYFCDQHYFEYDLGWYRQRMPLSYSHQITIEKSPCYIMERRHFERMMAFNSTIKVMVTVRNPLDLLLSKYAQMMSGYEAFGREVTSIESILLKPDGRLNTVFINKFAVYVQYLKELYNVIPREQIFIIDGDELINNPLSELRKIEQFIGVQPFFSDQDVYFDEEKGFYCYKYRDTGKSQCLGSSKGRRHETLKDELKTQLQAYLKPFNEELYVLIGRKFPWD